MKVDVWFGPDNTVTVFARNDNGIHLFNMAGTVEEVKDGLAGEITRLNDVREAMKTALARILYTPACWE